MRKQATGASARNSGIDFEELGIDMTDIENMIDDKVRALFDLFETRQKSTFS